MSQVQPKSDRNMQQLLLVLKRTWDNDTSLNTTQNIEFWKSTVSDRVSAALGVGNVEGSSVDRCFPISWFRGV